MDNSSELETLIELSNKLGSLEKTVDSISEEGFSTVLNKQDPLGKTDLTWSLSYSSYVLAFSLLKLKGIETKNHPIRAELVDF